MSYDEEDQPVVDSCAWRVQLDHRSGKPAAVVAGGNGNVILFHRVVARAPDGLLVDHKDRDPLNNCKSNLRLCSQAQNSRNRGIAKHNRSGFKGVYANRGRWRAEINVNGKRIRLGSYRDKVDAALAYDRAAVTFHGAFCVTNADLGVLN